MTSSVNWKAVRVGILGIVLSSLSAYYGQPLIHENTEAINLIVTTFSVLAGFLVAIIAIIGDPALLPPGSWRAAEMERGKVIARLRRHRMLFLLYLITLLFIFLAVLIPDKYYSVIIWLERIFLFTGVLAFTMSFLLPSSLMQAQEERINTIIEHKRSEEGITNKQ